MPILYLITDILYPTSRNFPHLSGHIPIDHLEPLAALGFVSGISNRQCTGSNYCAKEKLLNSSAPIGVGVV